MAFAVTQYVAHGIDVSEPVSTRAEQTFYMKVTALAADVALDLASDSGTFWTAAEADATYGSIAAAAHVVLNEIEARAKSRISWCCPQIQDVKQQVDASAAVATKQYKISTTGVTPSIAIFAAEGATSYDITIKVLLAKEQLPVRGSAG